MSRPLRIQFPDAWYHVMNRGRRREVVFCEEEDYLSFIEILKETTSLFNIRIAAFCLLPNHYHLLVQTPEGNISRCMRHINGVYTQRFNRRHNHDGQLFRGRYKAILVDSNYLAGLVRYIHRNPIRAGLRTRLNQYPWSSHHGYLTFSNKWNWLSKDSLFALFSPGRAKQLKEYKDFISEEDSKEVLARYSKKNLPSIIGSEKFIDRVKVKFREFAFTEEIPESKLLTPDAAKIRRSVCKVYKVKQTSLICGIKRGAFNEPRNAAVFLTRQLRRDSLKTIGKEYKIDNYSSVSSIIESMKKNIARNKKLKKRIEQIKKDVELSQKQT